MYTTFGFNTYTPVNYFKYINRHVIFAQRLRDKSLGIHGMTLDHLAIVSEKNQLMYDG